MPPGWPAERPAIGKAGWKPCRSSSRGDRSSAAETGEGFDQDVVAGGEGGSGVGVVAVEAEGTGDAIGAVLERGCPTSWSALPVTVLPLTLLALALATGTARREVADVEALVAQALRVVEEPLLDLLTNVAAASARLPADFVRPFF